MEVSAQSQPCLTRETGKWGLLFSKPEWLFSDTHPTTLPFVQDIILISIKDVAKPVSDIHIVVSSKQMKKLPIFRIIIASESDFEVSAVYRKKSNSCPEETANVVRCVLQQGS